MKNVILFDDRHESFKPLTWTRPVSELRIGILTIKEKWEKSLGFTVSCQTEAYLSDKYPIQYAAQNCLINATVLPNPELIKEIENLPPNRVLVKGEVAIALKVSEEHSKQFFAQQLPTHIKPIETDSEFLQIQHVWDLFQKNGAALAADFELLTAGRNSQPLSSTNRVIGDVNQVFLEEGASVECAVLNTTNGPIYVGKNAVIMEGALVRGGLALCEAAQLKMGAKIYGPSTLGPYCKVGGELTNTVFLGYANKGHDGYLGNSVIGEWCNLGADTNSSNLKNNYTKVRVWDYGKQTFAKTDLQFCGLIMGDHSKAGINTMFNTATVVGVSANVYGGGFPRTFIPSYTWGGSKGFMVYRLDKALETAKIVMKRRNRDLTEVDNAILKYVFEQTQEYRNWD
ncbi:MAG: glucose-1-phosphate thymidylyltransferase [Aureispira sp.]|nr:glucose-1-phosphate thymidylyltransferase [Aureispira sp.]